MSNDAFIKWIEQQDEIELHEKYLKHKKLEEDFETWTFWKYQTDIEDLSDHLYEQEKDRKTQEKIEREKE